MPQFDVHQLRAGELVVDVQSDLIGIWETRLVVPLISPDGNATPTRRLNPEFRLNGDRRILATQLAAAMRRRELGDPIASLAHHEYEIKAALDMLISGC